jgi:hypothetical protein
MLHKALNKSIYRTKSFISYWYNADTTTFTSVCLVLCLSVLCLFLSMTPLQFKLLNLHTLNQQQYLSVTNPGSFFYHSTQHGSCTIQNAYTFQDIL